MSHRLSQHSYQYIFLLANNKTLKMKQVLLGFLLTTDAFLFPARSQDIEFQIVSLP